MNINLNTDTIKIIKAVKINSNIYNVYYQSKLNNWRKYLVTVEKKKTGLFYSNKEIFTHNKLQDALNIICI